MRSMNPAVINVEALRGYKLRLVFENGEIRLFDVTPYLERGIFQQLQDEDVFSEAYVEFGSVEWPGGQGLSYDTLYMKSIPVPASILA